MAAQGNVPKGAEKIAKRLECSSTTFVQNMKKKKKKKNGELDSLSNKSYPSTEKWALREKNCGEPQTETRALQVVWGA